MIIETSNPTDRPADKPKSRRRFSLRWLLLLFAIICGVLAQYYPRTHYRVVIDLGALNKPERLAQALLIKNLYFLELTMREHPEIEKIASEKSQPAIQWLQESIQFDLNSEKQLELSIVGYAGDVEEMQLVVDAVAETFLKDAIRLDYETYEEMCEKYSVAREDVRQETSPDDVRAQKLLAAIDTALAKAQSQRDAAKLKMDSIKIIRRKSGWGK